MGARCCVIQNIELERKKNVICMISMIPIWNGYVFSMALIAPVLADTINRAMMEVIMTDNNIMFYIFY